ncbi:MAG: hypothetical protein ACRD1F_07255, partial [Terriglobales bacterium]
PRSPARAAATAAKAWLPPQQRSQVALLDAEIARRARNQKKLQAKLAALQTRLEQLPEVEQQLSGITNAYAVQKSYYNSLLQKKASAATAAAMEEQAEGQEFRIVDPANLPETPSSPNLPRLELMGALGGLLLGLGLAYWVEMRDPVVRSLEDMGFYTQVPTLAIVPLLPAAPDGRPQAARQG